MTPRRGAAGQGDVTRVLRRLHRRVPIAPRKLRHDANMKEFEGGHKGFARGAADGTDTVNIFRCADRWPRGDSPANAGRSTHSTRGPGEKPPRVRRGEATEPMVCPRPGKEWLRART
jgi:hypothetical protein